MAKYKIDWASNDAEEIVGKEPISLGGKKIDIVSTSLTLTGRGVSDYGEVLQENFIRLLEKFTASSVPPNPTVGQLWFNPTDVSLYMCVEIDKTPGFDFYYVNYPRAWLKIFPKSGAGAQGFEAATFAQYNALAIDINRIIGEPSEYNPTVSPQPTDQIQWGWGQTDLVPVYLDMNTLMPGFSTSVYPSKFSNESWIILLSRLRKALRQIGVTESTTSPVGFRNDGKPLSGSNALANSYNSYPSPGTRVNYINGWLGHSLAEVQDYYATTVSLIDQLKTERFNLATVSSQSQMLASVSHTSDWTETLVCNMDVTFDNRAQAQAFFNAGGAIKFVWSHNPSVIDTINSSWQSFLATVTNMYFDYAGTRYGTSYKNVSVAVNESRGFYDLSSTNKVIFERARLSSEGVYGEITDGGLRIYARTTETSSFFTINFEIRFEEIAALGETIRGTTINEAWAIKANSLNTNSPTLSFPSCVTSGTF